MTYKHIYLYHKLEYFYKYLYSYLKNTYFKFVIKNNHLLHLSLLLFLQFSESSSLNILKWIQNLHIFVKFPFIVNYELKTYDIVKFIKIPLKIESSINNNWLYASMKIRTLSSNLTAINYSRNRYATSSRTTRIAINARLEWPSPFPNSAENQFLFTIASISKDGCTKAILRYINRQNEVRLRINWCILNINYWFDEN